MFAARAALVALTVIRHQQCGFKHTNIMPLLYFGTPSKILCRLSALRARESLFLTQKVLF